jgi:hypothetical protein
MAKKDKIDYDMLANDITETLDRYGYLEHIGDIGEDEVRPLMPAFVAALRQAAEEQA